jgi:hypothetical protein
MAFTMFQNLHCIAIQQLCSKIHLAILSIAKKKAITVFHKFGRGAVKFVLKTMLKEVHKVALSVQYFFNLCYD